MEVKSTVTSKSVCQTIKSACDFKKMSIRRPRTPEYPNDCWDAEPGILPFNILFGFRSDTPGSEEKRAKKVAKEKGLPNLGEYLQLIVVPGKDSWMFPEGDNQLCQCDQKHPYNEVLMPFSALLNSLKDVSKKRGKPNLGAHICPYNPLDP
jgi:hypothetical protein